MGIGMLRQYHKQITEHRELTKVPEAVAAVLGVHETVAESAKVEEVPETKHKFSVKSKAT